MHFRSALPRPRAPPPSAQVWSGGWVCERIWGSPSNQQLRSPGLFAQRGARDLPPSGRGRCGGGRLGYFLAPGSGQRRDPRSGRRLLHLLPSDRFLCGFGLGLGRARSPFCNFVRASRWVSGFLFVLCSRSSAFAPKAALRREPTSPAPRTGRWAGVPGQSAVSLLPVSGFPGCLAPHLRGRPGAPTLRSSSDGASGTSADFGGGRAVLLPDVLQHPHLVPL